MLISTPTTGLACDNLEAKIQLRPTPPHPRTNTLSPNLILASLFTTLNPVESPHPNKAQKLLHISLFTFVILFSETMEYSESVVNFAPDIFLSFQVYIGNSDSIQEALRQCKTTLSPTLTLFTPWPISSTIPQPS